MKFGVLRYARPGPGNASGAWAFDNLPPHVVIRLKHVFPSIRAGDQCPIIMRHKPDTAADIVWFLERYPMEMSGADRYTLEAASKEYYSARADVEQLRAPTFVPPAITGFKDGESPYTYQIRAAQIFRQTGSLLLLDDVGLGKTVSALASISDGQGLPAVVIVQPHLTTQWVKEYIERFTHLKSVIVKSRKVENLPAADVYLFKYSNVAAWAGYIAQMGAKTMILDEVQECRHGGSTDKGTAIQHIREAIPSAMALTATPIYNYGSEMYNVVDIVRPGALGSWVEFTTHWCTTHGTHWIVKDPEALGSYLEEEGITLRRTCESEEVDLDLPPLHRVPINVEWNDGDVDDERIIQEALAQTILNGSFHEKGRAARELDVIMRKQTGIAKARAAASYVRMLAESGRPCVVGAWHRTVYDIMNKALSDLEPVMITGSETPVQKDKSKRKFMCGDSNVCLMSLRSGSGLDGLQTVASDTVFAELDWSPQVHTQFNGRLRRAGQTKPVTAHYLITDGGSDPVLMEVNGLKKSQSTGILNPYQRPTESVLPDDGRMNRLAKHVLGIEDVTSIQ